MQSLCNSILSVNSVTEGRNRIFFGYFGSSISGTEQETEFFGSDYFGFGSFGLVLRFRLNLPTPGRRCWSLEENIHGTVFSLKKGPSPWPSRPHLLIWPAAAGPPSPAISSKRSSPGCPRTPTTSTSTRYAPTGELSPLS